MTHHSTPTQPPSRTSWTIARIQNALSNPALERRFLTDLIHAPVDQITNVFTAWQRVAADIEAHADKKPDPW